MVNCGSAASFAGLWWLWWLFIEHVQGYPTLPTRARDWLKPSSWTNLGSFLHGRFCSPSAPRHYSPEKRFADLRYCVSEIQMQLPIDGWTNLHFFIQNWSARLQSDATQPQDGVRTSSTALLERRWGGRAEGGHRPFQSRSSVGGWWAVFVTLTRVMAEPIVCGLWCLLQLTTECDYHRLKQLFELLERKLMNFSIMGINSEHLC